MGESSGGCSALSSALLIVSLGWESAEWPNHSCSHMLMKRLQLQGGSAAVAVTEVGACTAAGWWPDAKVRASGSSMSVDSSWEPVDRSC